jgi:hypothetical protein
VAAETCVLTPAEQQLASVFLMGLLPNRSCSYNSTIDDVLGI